MPPVKVKRILLVHSAHYDDKGKVVRADKIIDKLTIANVVHSALIVLASYLPNEIDLELIEDCFEEVPFDDHCEVVAISAQVMQIDRAIDIAKKFRAKGKIVLMGGYLPSMHPEKIAPYVDSYCIGDGDSVFLQMIKDIEAGTLKKEYRGNSQAAIDQMPIPRFDLIKKDRMIIYPIQATRGCPFRCNYCSIIQVNEYSYRHRLIEHIIRDIKAANSKYIFFTDDNLMEDKEFCKKLFKEMIPLNIEWGTQTTINCNDDSELLTLAHKSGCRFLAIGIESISQNSLAQINKNFNKAHSFENQINNIHRSGISVHALIIFGLEDDTPESLHATLDFLNRMNIAVAEFFTCTPYPATPLGKEYLKRELIIDHNLSHYREGYIIYKHPTMTADIILKNFWWAYRTFYNPWKITKRILKGKYKNKIYHMANAFTYWIKIKRNILPVYFGPGNAPVMWKNE